MRKQRNRRLVFCVCFGVNSGEKISFINLRWPVKTQRSSTMCEWPHPLHAHLHKDSLVILIFTRGRCLLLLGLKQGYLFYSCINLCACRCLIKSFSWCLLIFEWEINKKNYVREPFLLLFIYLLVFTTKTLLLRKY